MVGGSVGGGWVNTAKIKVVPFTTSALRCVCVCVGVSVSPQILRWGPAGADRTPFISPLPLQNPVFLCGCRRPCVSTYACVCVCASRLDLLSVGLMLKWLTAEQSQGRLRAVVGREGPYSLTAFSPEGEEGDKYREADRRKTESKQINRLHRGWGLNR